MLKIKKFNMILSLPNTGSDWLAKVICDTNENIEYAREFFNPICNRKYETDLKPYFGCEMGSCEEGIAKKITEKEYDDIFAKTWGHENYNYTKENYSSFKVEHHVRNFNCCVLYRRLSKTLPGQRDWCVVDNWYCSMFYSLKLNLETIEDSLKPLVEFSMEKAEKFEEQCAMAHLIYYSKLFLEANKYSLPIINYDILIDGEELDVMREVKKIPGVRSNDLASKIIETRIVSERKKPISCSSIIEDGIELMPKEIKHLFVPW